MARELTERTAAILDSVSTWEGVCRVVRSDRTTTLRADGRAFGRVGETGVETRLPGRLPRTAVRHGLADARAGDWTALELDEATTVQDGTVLLRVAYLSHVASSRQRDEGAFPDVDLDDALAELHLSPGVIHLVRNPALV
jgi:hypothetical protein